MWDHVVDVGKVVNGLSECEVHKGARGFKAVSTL